jgi:hypothetical protein
VRVLFEKHTIKRILIELSSTHEQSGTKISAVRTLSLVFLR